MLYFIQLKRIKWVFFFFEFSCFFYDLMNVGNLISGSSAFSKSSLYICKLLVHILLKPSLKDFEHYFASTWNEHNCAVVWILFGFCPSLRLEWKLIFSSPVATAEFPKFAGNKTANGQFSFQSQRTAMPKNVQTTMQLRSFHIPAK